VEDPELASFECKCVSCQKIFMATKSERQRDFGEHDQGRGTCPYCRKVLNLTFIPEEGRFISRLWDDFLPGRAG
jgi:hypothetical protein